MKSYNTILKIAPAFLLFGSILSAQTTDSVGTKKIEEVVLIGYGKQKKSDVTGSITSITSKDFNGGATSPAQLIQGKTPGVQITTNSGAPGAGSSIRIRGGSSLNGSNSPLIVIDGVPQDFSGISGAADPLSLINPNDIASFDILKDASATAIYGNRASNGVILITTKKGTSGKLKVNFSTLASVSEKMGNVDVLNADDYRAFINQYATPTYKARLGNSDTNWQDKIYQQAWGTDNNLALSGGLKWLPYRLSLGYNEQNGIVRTNSFKRSAIGLNLNPVLFDKHLKIDVSLKGTYTDNRFVDGGVIPTAILFDPTQSVYSGNNNFGGYYENLLNGGLNVNGTANPLSTLMAIHDVTSVYRGLGNIQLDYKVHFLPDLHVNVNAGYDYSKGEGRKTVDANLRAGFFNKGSITEFTQEKKNKLLETYLSYVKTISAINTNIDLTAGYSYQDFETISPGGTTFLGNAAPTTNPDFSTGYTLLSFYGRGIFTVADKYILSASVRRDGSSRFFNGTRDNIYGVFPSVSGAWKINDENFLKDNRVVSTLKLRAGYGETGNQEVGSDFPAFAKYNLSGNGAQYQFGSTYYFFYRPEIYNPNLTWETTTTKNLGLDFGFLKERITGSVDIYQKDTKDLLVDSPIAAGDLSNRNLLNVGNSQNKGIEGSINFVPVKKENLSWEIGFNATHFNPIVTKLLERSDATFNIPQGGISGGVGNTVQAHAVGFNPYSFYLYQQVYDGSGNPIDGVYADRNGDGNITAADKYYYKSTTPDAILGFNTKLVYKDWDFGMSGRAVLGNYVYNNAASNSSIAAATTNDYLQNVYSTTPQYKFQNSQFFSDIFVENASFFRLDNVNIGYNFKNFLSTQSNMRIYAMAQNVFVISKYTGVDPEVFSGIDNGYYQLPHVYSLGFNFQF
ncbi:SusC/RagA family TonB-linked outer membrane protein [Halpernia frigidisoli]|uniref:Iron complex outermembrane recepter protein n=1 Tax=Halpernia frigidisoli TaxID=1125876 RepID=A0A1I3DR67_9FLAO|nr:SusC/RagA family TonB-linked outer membrane protein [Halpernia frigidisoli]SFH89202.1 iron complex outermembrane recepter protein [Halpernia frigidisoli]